MQMHFSQLPEINTNDIITVWKVRVAHTRLLSVGFRSWSRFLAVSLQVMSHKPGGRLPLLCARPAVTPTTLKRAATNFGAWWTEAQWVWTVCLRLLPHSAFSAVPSVLWRLLVGWQEGHLACKNWVVGCWRGYLSWARCRLAYGPADATATHCLLLQ